MAKKSKPTPKSKTKAKARATEKKPAKAKPVKAKPVKAKPPKAKPAKAKPVKAKPVKAKPHRARASSSSADAIVEAIGDAAWQSGAHVGAPPATGPAIIDGDAAAMYSLQFHVRGEITNNAITLYRGNTRIAGDLALDYSGDDSPDGTIVDGDLDVDGTIVNRNSDSGPFLLVTGNVRAKNLIGAGSEIVVLGDLVVDGVIFGFYNHGAITVHGATRAKAIITEYHAFDLRGRVEGITVSGRGDITDADMFDRYAPALVPEILADGNPEGGYPDWDLTMQAILEGRPVLRDDVLRDAG